MGHNISHASGRAEFFAANQPAWHGLGTIVKGTRTWAEAIKLAGLNWLAEKRQLEYKGKPVDAFGIFRSDTHHFLGAVGKKYTVIQNKDVFTMLDALVEVAGGAHYEAAGALGVGERIWALVKVPEEIIIKGTDDRTKMYLLGTNPHDGTGCNIYKMTGTRVVCENTMNIALSLDTKSELRIRHTKSFDEKMVEARKVLVGIRQEVKGLQDKLNFLKSKKLTQETMQTVLYRLFPNLDKSEVQKNQARDVLTIYENNDGNKFPTERGTALNLYNAVTNWVDHDRTVRVATAMKTGEHDNDKAVVDVARARSAMFGTGNHFKDAALENILSVVGGKDTGSTATLTDVQVDADIENLLGEVERGSSQS